MRQARRHDTRIQWMPTGSIFPSLRRWKSLLRLGLDTFPGTCLPGKPVSFWGIAFLPTSQRKIPNALIIMHNPDP